MRPILRENVDSVEWAALEQSLGTTEGLKLFRVPENNTGFIDRFGDEVIHAGSAFRTTLATGRDADTIKDMCDIPVLYRHEPLNKRAWRPSIYQYGDIWQYGIEAFVSEWFGAQLGQRFVMVSSAPSIHDYGAQRVRLVGYVSDDDVVRLVTHFKQGKIAVHLGYFYGMSTEGGFNYNTKVLTPEHVDALLETPISLRDFYHFVKALPTPKVSAYWFNADKVVTAWRDAVKLTNT